MSEEPKKEMDLPAPEPMGVGSLPDQPAPQPGGMGPDLSELPLPEARPAARRGSGGSPGKRRRR